MRLNINLFVHGVPMGQKIWGPKGDDERYLSSFYGPKWDAPELIKVDVMGIGGTAQCYYTFVRGRNVCDSSGRAGSYFALTLKMNAFYTDVQNIYNILKAVYNKMCVGLCVQEENGMVKYLLSDFQSIDSKLKEMEGHLLNYISNFSNSNDIVPLSGFTANGQAVNLNLFECDEVVATEQIKKVGHLIVSPHYLSSDTAKIVAQCKADTQSAIQRAQQEIQLLKTAAQDEKAHITKQAEERIDSITRESQEELKACQEQYNARLTQVEEECDKRIAEIQNRYKDIDADIKFLEQSIKERNKEISDLRLQCAKKNEENKKLRQQQLYKLQDTSGENPIGAPSSPKHNRLSQVDKRLVRIVVVLVVLLLVLLVFFRPKIKNTSKINEINKETVATLAGNEENDSTNTK